MNTCEECENCEVCGSSEIYEGTCMECNTKQETKAVDKVEWRGENSVIVRCRRTEQELRQERETKVKELVKEFGKDLIEALGIDFDELWALYERVPDVTCYRKGRLTYASLIVFLKGGCLRYVCKETSYTKREIECSLKDQGLILPSSLEDYVMSAVKVMKAEAQEEAVLQELHRKDQMKTNGKSKQGIVAAILKHVGLNVKDLVRELKISEMTIKSSYDDLYKRNEERRTKDERRIENARIEDARERTEDAISTEFPLRFNKVLKKLNRGAQDAAKLWYHHQELTVKEISERLETVSQPTIRSAIRKIKEVM